MGINDNIETRRAYQRARWKKYYKGRDKDRDKETLKARIVVTRKWYIEYKSKLKCSRCTENHPSCLQFHHTDPAMKKDHVSILVNGGSSIKRVLEEINKCEVLCANCHMKLHWNEKQILMQGQAPGAN